jgi:AcrR family transcriptional regulator
MQTNTQEKSSTRDKVLSTALSLFTKKGYFSTSMRDITGESAVSTGSVYHYFKDKEGVAAALYQSMIERMRESLHNIASTNDSAHDQCRAVISLLFKIAEEEPEIMSFMLYTKHHEFLPDERPVCSSEPFEIMRSMVQFGMDNGEIEKRDVLVASTCLFGGAIRMVTSHLDGILDNPLSGYLDDIWICSWRAVASDDS